MTNEHAKDHLEEEALNASTEEVDSLDQDAEAQELFEELCVLLEGVIPEDVFSIIQNIKPIQAAVYALYQLGGRIRINQPEVDLTVPYEYPTELDELDEKVGAFTFYIAPTPFFALAVAMQSNIDADREVVQACDLKSYVPIIIEENDEVKRIGLINYKDHILELTMDFGFGIRADMTGDAAEDNETLHTVLKEFANGLDEAKDTLAQVSPKLFDSDEEEQAITAWCNKHSYRVIGAVPISIDLYH